jgi:hypothetical protein
MAKHDIREDKAKVRFRFFDFELEGSNAALESTVRTMATTLARRDGNGNSKSLATAAAAALPSGQTVESDNVDVDEEIEVSPQPVRPKPTKRSVEKAELLDLDFRSAAVPLSDYIAAHDVGDADWRRYLAIAKWFKEHMGVGAVTTDHIFTAYRTLGWKVPPRIRQPLIDGKRQKGWYRMAGKGCYEITHIGEDEIVATNRGEA